MVFLFLGLTFSATRRFQAAEWLRQMDQGARETLSKEPSEEDFCLALRNGLILCNVLNKVNPGAVHKVVDNSVPTVQSTEGAAQSAIQYFENVRNFLVAVGKMKLLTFDSSDLEKGGSSSKVVDCILCLKGYYEWKQSGGLGVWRYGGTVKITSFQKESSSSSVCSESADESLDEYESSQYDQLLEFLHLSTKVSKEESKAAKALSILFDRFGLGILQAYLTEKNGIEDFSLNAMVIDTVIRKVVKDFSALLVSQGIQLGLLLKKILKNDVMSTSNEEFLEVISQYLSQKTASISSELSEFCICGGKGDIVQPAVSLAADCKGVIDGQQKQIAELKMSIQEAKLEVKKVQSNWEEEVRKLENHIKGLEVASSSYYKVLEENRQLYNQVQDLKGTIRVYCRVRPFLPAQHDQQSTVDYIGENGNIMIVNPNKQGRDARRVFSFNKVFGTTVTQQQIYGDTQPLIRSVLDGYNVCIFAYGQTGSGKTYTMSGPDLTTEETWGVNFRALNDLFEISKLRTATTDYEIGVQMIEIYNEQVRDLLVADGSTRRLDIRNNSQLNGLNVPDASLVPVTCTRDVLDLMRIGLKNRAVGATALNERSSRSHSILTVHVHGKELLSGTILRGSLHLVDLAGSERVDKSEAIGERLREAQHINKSLSALGDVISALAQKSPHIPYRNSKLTQVLQDSLGGQAKTLMFVHINPELDAIGETISTLKFAERVASIDLGAARSNKETTEIRDLKEEISNLKLALEKKEANLEHLKSANMKSTPELQKARAISPMRLPTLGIASSSKPEVIQRHIDDRSFEARSCSSGKQRRSRIPSASTDRETIQKLAVGVDQRLQCSAKSKSPSPPVRRSLSTDRGALIRSRLKPDITEEPIKKLQFPAKVSVNRSVAATTIQNITKGNSHLPEILQQYNISDVTHSVQRTNSNKNHPEHDDEQFKHVLTVRQGVLRKSRQENRVKSKTQLSSRVQKSDATITLLSDLDMGGKMEEAQNSDFSELENEQELVTSPVTSNSKLKKLRPYSRSSQNLEPRGQVLMAESLLATKLENKLPTGMIRNPKEVSNTSMLELRRSRSTPRGKFLILP
ncbi:hypothetical protein Ancab_024891 [Ancistrocladus abbreviatus]